MRDIIRRKLPRAEDAELLIDIYEHGPYPSDAYKQLCIEDFARRLCAELVTYLRDA